MIDTMVLTLKFNDFKITEPELFHPSANRIINAQYQYGGKSFEKCVQNPSKKVLRNGNSAPRLTLIRRIKKHGNYEIVLRVEISIPKLLFNNNYHELVNDDFFDAVIILREKLEEMGVEISEANLATSNVSGVHFGKNIILRNFTTPYTYISQLAKLNIHKSLDVSQSDYKNGGSGWKCHANTYEVAFYDKGKELDLNNINTPFELLRYEVRLNTRQKIKHILNKIEINSEPTFYNIFSLQTAKNVLLYYLSRLEEAYPPILVSDQNAVKDVFNELLINNPKIKLHIALKLAAFKVILEEVGVREFRNLTKRYGNYAWYSLNQQAEEYVVDSENRDVFPFLRKEIEKFKPLIPVDFEAEMLNNDKYDK